jgi:hypothetical protein
MGGNMKALPALESCRTVSMSLLINIMILIFIVIVFPLRVYGAETQKNVGPIVNIKDRVYDFGLAVDGEVVIHDFLLQNPGSSVLEIQKVKTD